MSSLKTLAPAVVQPDREEHYNEFFNARKPAAFAVRLIRQFHVRMLAFAEKKIPGFHGLSLLEVGPGWGYLADACKVRGISYSGLEMNAQQAAALCQAGHNVSPGTIPPFPPGPPVEVIWMSHVLEHAPNYLQAREIAASALDRLEPGGYLVVICPDLKSYKTEFWNSDWSHGFPTTVRRVKQILAEVGFTIFDARHHTCTFTNPVLVAAATFLCSLLPVTFLDFFFERLTGKPLCYSFMNQFGWRQLLVIARKPGSAPA